MVGTNPFRPICLSACLRTSNQNPFSYSGHQRELKKRKRKEREKREEKKKKARQEENRKGSRRKKSPGWEIEKITIYLTKMQGR
jgi:hypothetical protein